MKYDFDTVYDRHHTNCAKIDIIQIAQNMIQVIQMILI